MCFSPFLVWYKRIIEHLFVLHKCFLVLSGIFTLFFRPKKEEVNSKLHFFRSDAQTEFPSRYGSLCSALFLL